MLSREGINPRVSRLVQEITKEALFSVLPVPLSLSIFGIGLCLFGLSVRLSSFLMFLNLTGMCVCVRARMHYLYSMLVLGPFLGMLCFCNLIFFLI